MTKELIERALFLDRQISRLDYTLEKIKEINEVPYEPSIDFKRSNINLYYKGVELDINPSVADEIFKAHKVELEKKLEDYKEEFSSL